MKTFARTFISLTLFTGAVSCGDSVKQEETASGPIQISDTLLRTAEPVEAKSAQVANTLNLVGKISFDENKVVKVYALAGGIVEDLKVELGDYVQKGEVLATIRSAEIADMVNALQSAESDFSIAQKNYEANQQLFASGLSSEKDVIIAKNELARAKSNVEKNQELLQLYKKGKTPSQYEVVSPISGYIVAKNLTQDMQFRADASDDMFTISALDEVWVLANVYENDIPKVSEGDTVSVTTLAYPDAPIPGVINKVFNVLDPTTRTMQVRIKLANPKLMLKPEMFAKVEISYLENKNLPVVPSASIVFDNSQNYVIVYRSKTDLEVRKVSIYRVNGNQSYIESGLSAGEKVLTNNLLLIYSALNKD